MVTILVKPNGGKGWAVTQDGTVGNEYTGCCGFAKALAVEFSSKGIRFNMVSPSLTDTELVSDIPKRVKMLIEAKTPLGKLCTIEDIANCISFLMLPKSDFLTGETIRLNGGQFML